MIKPSFLEPEDRPAILGHVFGTPMVVKGWSGLPVVELVVWVILSWVARRNRPAWTLKEQVWAGAVTTTIMLGSEWCHNLAHTALAHRIGKPVDAIRIVWGMPLLIYYDINDQLVSPRQHILRALGGPVFNGMMVLVAWLAKGFTHQGTPTRYAVDFALGTNSFLSTVSLFPIPGIDGGPILKWSLVERGHSPAQADELVKGVNRILGSGLGLAAGLALKKRRKWLGLVLAAFAATSLAIGFGYLKER